MKFILFGGYLCLLTQETEDSSELKHLSGERSGRLGCMSSMDLQLFLAAC